MVEDLRTTHRRAASNAALFCALAALGARARGRSTSSLDLDMRVTPDSAALRRWRLWVGAVLIAEICWFALLHPRIAGNFRSILVLALLPLTVVGYVYLMAAVSRVPC